MRDWSDLNGGALFEAPGGTFWGLYGTGAIFVGIILAVWVCATAETKLVRALSCVALVGLVAVFLWNLVGLL